MIRCWAPRGDAGEWLCTCLLPRGHPKPHKYTPNHEIVMFAYGYGEIKRADGQEAGKG